MTAPDNQALFTVINIEGFSKNNPQIIDQYFATDFVEHQFGFNPPNADGVKKAMAELHAAFRTSPWSSRISCPHQTVPSPGDG